jgi:hypothetical protein
MSNYISLNVELIMDRSDELAQAEDLDSISGKGKMFSLILIIQTKSMAYPSS